MRPAALNTQLPTLLGKDCFSQIKSPAHFSTCTHDAGVTPRRYEAPGGNGSAARGRGLFEKPILGGSVGSLVVVVVGSSKTGGRRHG